MAYQYRFSLEPYRGTSSRYYCPQCNDSDKSFTRYIDNKTGKYIADHVGMCSRLNRCGYHYPPREYFKDNSDKKTTWTKNKSSQQTKLSAKTKLILIQTIPIDVLENSLTDNKYRNNVLIEFLYQFFGAGIAKDLISRYLIGTYSNNYGDATVFWYISQKEEIMYGKMMYYKIVKDQNSFTGKNCKRIKNKNDHIVNAIDQDYYIDKARGEEWITKYMQQPRKINCFFGEDLITGNDKSIAIVESEKTAIIASVYLPQFIWLACGSLTNLSRDKCKVLEGRNVILFPDLNGYDKWSERAKEFGFQISDLLECWATEAEKEQGLDLADYLIRFDYRDFLSNTTLMP